MTPELYATTGTTLKWLLGLAWLLPLGGFCAEILAGYWSTRRSKTAAWIATGCIGAGFVLSLAAFLVWGSATEWGALSAHASAEHVHTHDHGHQHGHAHEHAGHTDRSDAHKHAHGDATAHAPYTYAFSGSFYQFASFGDLIIDIDYYIDSLTILMFLMVTLIASCIHVFAIGYMSDELTDDYEDHNVHVSGGRHFHRPGRFPRFFAFLSLFCFSMLGLVLAGNVFQVFIFWELVGVCSYFLIGFYVERKSASTAANKAFIMNRVGDFGFLIGLMVILTCFGTFKFADTDPETIGQAGLFQMLRDHDGQMDVQGTGADRTVYLQNGAGGRWLETGTNEPRTIPYWLLTVAGLGIFAGCIGKSAQFPLQTWLPDAMEGPTPVSALVHSATMVAAGVYLAARFTPVFVPEVLLVIAYIGCITLFIGATIALVVTDIKRVLAYSTISQLGYMMLALGVGGWFAGLFHLVTHAFFKSLMFLASGSVIHGCHHVQDMQQMGGLRKKMPWTAAAMLVGIIAITGLAIPTPWFALAFSGFHSKDAVLATSLSFFSLNPKHYLLFVIPLVTAGLTAFYMFRLWFLTFAGAPRNPQVHQQAHESPRLMTGPLVVLSLFAIFCAIGGESGLLGRMLLASEPAQSTTGIASVESLSVALPGHAQIHEKHALAGGLALLMATTGTFLAWVCYGAGWLNPAGIRTHLQGVNRFLVDKWKFDALYDLLFVRPTHVVASWAQRFDRSVLDAGLHRLSGSVLNIARWDRAFDEKVVDKAVNVVGDLTFSAGRSMKQLQTGRLRHYVMFIAFGVLGLFLALFAFLPRS